MKITLVLGMLYLISFQTMGQSGPHSANGNVIGFYISQDNDKLLTLSYYEVVLWDLESKKPIWIKRYSEYNLPEPLYIDNWKVEPTLTGYLYIQTSSDKILINLTSLQMKKTNQLFSNFTYNGKGVVTNYNGKNFIVDLDTDKSHEIKDFSGGAVTEDGKKLVSWYKNNIYKEYDFETHQISKVDYSKKTELRNDRFNATVGQEYSVSLKPIEKDILIYDLNHKHVGRFSMKTKGIKEPSCRLVKGLTDKPYLYTFEVNNIAKPEGTIFQNYIVLYQVPSGEIVNVIELNNSSQEAQVELEKKIKEVEHQRKEDEVRRQQMMIQSKNGYKEFDGKFTSINFPYAVQDQSAIGFEINDPFIVNDLQVKPGSKIYGIGRVCSCKDFNTYLIITKNSIDQQNTSNYYLVTYRLDGNLIASKNIGASQLNAKGNTYFECSINGTNCDYTIKGKFTNSNGVSQIREYRYSGCSVINK
jgi:hypothetical protein